MCLFREAIRYGGAPLTSIVGHCALWGAGESVSACVSCRLLLESHAKSVRCFPLPTCGECTHVVWVRDDYPLSGAAIGLGRCGANYLCSPALLAAHFLFMAGNLWLWLAQKWQLRAPLFDFAISHIRYEPLPSISLSFLFFTPPLPHPCGLRVAVLLLTMGSNDTTPETLHTHTHTHELQYSTLHPESRRKIVGPHRHTHTHTPADIQTDVRLCWHMQKDTHMHDLNG